MLFYLFIYLFLFMFIYLCLFMFYLCLFMFIYILFMLTADTLNTYETNSVSFVLEYSEPPLNSTHCSNKW